VMRDDRVAVLHFFRGSARMQDVGEILEIHAWIPFISTAHGFRLPYQRESVSLDYRQNILRDVWTLGGEILSAGRLTSPRIDPSRHSSIVSPKRQGSMDFGESRKYRKSLATCAQAITERLGLEDHIFKFLFSLENKVELIQICTTELDIPWDWIYDRDKNRFLCEVFGVGVTYPDSEQPISRYQRRSDCSVTESQLASRQYTALLVANTYVHTDHPTVKLGLETDRLAAFLRRPFGSMAVDVLKDQKRKTLLSVLRDRASALRLICFCGHFSDLGFRTSDGRHLARDSLMRAFEGLGDEPLEAQPLVVLNGCRTGGTSRYAMPQIEKSRDLARAFLDLGAEACMVTSTDVRLQYSIQFLELFLENLLTPNTTLGVALLNTRNSMDKNRTYEWAAYHLLGDPTYVMVRSDDPAASVGEEPVGKVRAP